MGVKIREKPRGSGDWWVFIDHRGKRKAKKIGKDKKFAQQVVKQIEAKLVLGDTGFLTREKESVSFRDYAMQWLDLVVPSNCKVSTTYDYEAILKNHILPVFGEKQIAEIKRLQVKEFLMKKLKTGYAASTVTHFKNVLGGVFNLALDGEVIADNPAHRLGRLLYKNSAHTASSINPLTREELTVLMRTVQESFPEYYPFLLTLARTGLRLGEAIGLHWNDIDFERRIILVQRSLSKGKISTPKNGKGRNVDMSMQLTETLWRLNRDRVRKMGSNMPLFVFLTETGKPYNETRWRRDVFNKALKIAGLRHIRTHDLRHTYVSLLIQAGESLTYIRDQVGHHSIKVTVDIYGHLVPGANKQAVDKLDDPTSTATIRNLSATTSQNKDSGIAPKSL